MAQLLAADFPIDPAVTSGSALAGILNRFEQAVGTSNSGATAPPDTYPGMLWLDTSGGGDGVLRMRNAANSAWSPVPLAGGTVTGDLTVTKASGTAIVTVAAPANGDAWLALRGAGVAAAASFDIYQSANAATLWNKSNLPIIIGTNAGERVRIHAAGGLTVGANGQAPSWNPGGVRSNAGFESGAGQFNFDPSSVVPAEIINRKSGGMSLYGGSAVPPLKISSANNLALGGAAFDDSYRITMLTDISASARGIQIYDTSTGGGVSSLINMTAPSRNLSAVSSSAVILSDQAGNRITLLWNGGIGNVANNNYGTCDARAKRNITPAGGYLDKMNAIPVKTFTFVNGVRTVLGVTAQDVQAVAPELVTEDTFTWDIEPEGGGEPVPVALMGVYNIDFMFGMLKALQELTARVVALEATP